MGNPGCKGSQRDGRELALPRISTVYLLGTSLGTCLTVLTSKPNRRGKSGFNVNRMAFPSNKPHNVLLLDF